MVMGKDKLKRFAEIKTFDNVIHPIIEYQDISHPLKGKWHEEFKSKKPIILELGCGRGEYTVGLAQKLKEKNFIGIDIKGARFWRGAKTALENKLTNVAFVRTQIELVDSIFSKAEVDEIWITFPDPQIKYKRTKHRMTNHDFLLKYNHILKEDGIINLKTDSEFMHGYTLGLLHGEGHEILHANHDVYKDYYSPDEVTGTQTFYEKKYLEKGKAITYIKFRLNF